MTQILKMQGIEKRFGGVHALRGVDFDISAGEAVALVGERGQVNLDEDSRRRASTRRGNHLH
jgi:ABC-type transporter Mla maintaining outer membrane lipid asymmetry ATPase subunit MlaF